MSAESSSAASVIESVADPGTFQAWTVQQQMPSDEAYAASLERARQRSGTAEAVVVGELLLAGQRLAVIAGEFGFLAGSVGAAAAETIVAALDRATAEKLPVLAMPTSGGTRMQEGTPAFLQMVPIAAAVARHRRAGLAYLVWLRDPTTGGVMATWGSLGQVCVGAPGALAGFLGPRVYEAVFSQGFPTGVQVTENLVRVGVIDAVVPQEELREWVRRVLAVVAAPGESNTTAAPGDRGRESDGSADKVGLGIPDAWDCVLATRDPDRPGVREFLAAVATDVTELSGTGEGERDPGILLALARLAGRSCVVVGQDRSAAGTFGPGGLRTARRGYRLATELGLPLLTVVDTEGAELSAAAEEGAMAGEIARNLAELSLLPVRVVALLLGSGCGGGALALLPSDVLVAAADTWITPLPPEGASAIVHRTTDEAPRMAREQRITAVELASLGVVDALVPPLTAGGEADFLGECADAVAQGLWLPGQAPTPDRIGRFTRAVGPPVAPGRPWTDDSGDDR